jgi:hypothetical protein
MFFLKNIKINCYSYYPKKILLSFKKNFPKNVFRNVCNENNKTKEAVNLLDIVENISYQQLVIYMFF